MRPDETKPSKKRQLIHRIVELNKVMGSAVTELYYEDYEIPSLEHELEQLEELIEEEA